MFLRKFHLLLSLSTQTWLLAIVQSSTIPQFPLHQDVALQDHFDNSYNVDLYEHRLIQIDENQQPILVNELDKIYLKQSGINFMDITESGDISTLNYLRPRIQYHLPNNSKMVQYVNSELSTKGLREHLEKLTSFRTRYYRSSTGKQSQQWLLQQIKGISSAANRTDISVHEYEHNWGQNTIIARINGSSSELSNEIVVVGAHQDSTNIFPFLSAPGADDDGSGTVTILEAFRALLTCSYKPLRTVEFHWYSAEEGGLLGSQAVAKSYANKQYDVYGMIQMDMTAWVKAGTREEVGIITDFTDSDLTEFNKKLVEEYLSIPYVETQCGYACSDHASWRKAGYRSSFTIESSFENSNPHIHSSNDRIDVSPEFSFDHMLEFSKLAVAFAVELAGPKE